MSKPTFAEVKAPEPKAPKPVEKTAVWVKKDRNGGEYLSIKINKVDLKELDENGTLYVRAFKVKTKRTETSPDFVGFEKAENAGTN